MEQGMLNLVSVILKRKSLISHFCMNTGSMLKIESTNFLIMMFIGYVINWQYKPSFPQHVQYLRWR
jgi:hypothetical protein